MIDRYDHRAKTYDGYTGDNKYGRAPGIPAATDDQKVWPEFEIEPRYWMMEPVVKRRIHSVIGDRTMIGFRKVSRPFREQRSVKGAILPRYGATDGLPILAIGNDHVFPFLAAFNSACFDFLVRGHMPGPNVSLTWMLAQIPVPIVDTLTTAGANARRLSLTSYTVAIQFGIEPYRWDPEERDNLVVETDALVAHAYGLTQIQYATILDSFEVIARMQISEYGRYKFKDDCLEAYRRIS